MIDEKEIIIIIIIIMHCFIHYVEQSGHRREIERHPVLAKIRKHELALTANLLDAKIAIWRFLNSQYSMLLIFNKCDVIMQQDKTGLTFLEKKIMTCIYFV